MVKKVAKKNGDLISTLRHLQDIVMRILKTCSECGKSFVASKMTNKYCSRQCANVVKRRNESIRKGKLKEESKSEEQNVKIQELYLKPFLTPKEVSVLLGVCLTTVYRYFYSGNPTIDVCFDADRLDLGRVGIVPNPKRMATEQGAYYAANIYLIDEDEMIEKDL